MRFWQTLGQPGNKRRRIALIGTALVFSVLGIWLLSLSSAAPTEPGSETAQDRTIRDTDTDIGIPGTPAGINGRLQVCGLRMCNQYGRPVQLRGMSTHGLQWYGWGDCLNPVSIAALADDWKADILRVSMYVQEGGYETDPARFTAMADKVIDAAIAEGLYVLIDWHQLEPGDPNYNTARAKTYFSHMAQRYGNKPNVIYEIANEPNGVAWPAIKRYAAELVPHIRAIDPDNIIVAGTPGWDTFGLADDGAADDIYGNPLRGTNLMYSFHFYAAAHDEDYLAKLDEASDRLPVFVTEWGTQEDTGDGGNDFANAQRYIDLMARKQISWTSWNYSDDERSGAAFVPGTCPDGPYGGRQAEDSLKPAGSWVRQRIREPADIFPVR